MNSETKTVKTEPLSFDGQGCLMIGHPGNKRLLAQFEDADALETIVERYNSTALVPELLTALEGMLNWARRVKQCNPGPEIMNAHKALDKARPAAPARPWYSPRQQGGVA